VRTNHLREILYVIVRWTSRGQLAEGYSLSTLMRAALLLPNTNFKAEGEVGIFDGEDVGRSANDDCPEVGVDEVLFVECQAGSWPCTFGRGWRKDTGLDALFIIEDDDWRGGDWEADC